MRRTDREITDRTEIVNVLSRCDTVRLGMRGKNILTLCRYPSASKLQMECRLSTSIVRKKV